MSITATYTGRLIDLKNLDLHTPDIDEIAHHLTGINRYGGCQDLSDNYNVAYHSILLCEHLCWNEYTYEVALLALLHDASEAYLGDVPSGVKKLLPDYLELESKVQNWILCGLDLEFLDTDDNLRIVNTVDRRILGNEVHALFPNNTGLIDCVKNVNMLPKCNIKRTCNKEEIKERFLNYYWELHRRVR